jgi:hypothetical protein
MSANLNIASYSLKKLRGGGVGPRHFCRRLHNKTEIGFLEKQEKKCVQSFKRPEIEFDPCIGLDCQAAMLQAISIGREIPMLEPWIIDEIRRREEERRRGDRPQLELPLPDPQWLPDGNLEEEQGDQDPERGVVIIGM